MENLLTNFESCFIQHGIPVVGAVDFESALPLYQEHAKRYANWVARGSHGEMGYLQRGLERRLNPNLVFPELQSVITILFPYHATPVGNEQLRYARYLNGKDYHVELQEKMKLAMESLAKQNPGLSYKICVDTSAVLERSWAMLCGLGWIGKNTLLIHPQLGSYVFIGVIFTNQKVGRAPQLLKDYCGSCTKCLQACPTGALPEPHYLESRDCISYLTLEKRGPWEKPMPTKGFIAGCDLCQEACPFNTKSVKANEQMPQPIQEYLEFDLEKLKQETEQEYLSRVKDTALSRIKFQDFKRNLNALKN